MNRTLSLLFVVGALVGCGSGKAQRPAPATHAPPPAAIEQDPTIPRHAPPPGPTHSQCPRSPRSPTVRPGPAPGSSADPRVPSTSPGATPPASQASPKTPGVSPGRSPTTAPAPPKEPPAVSPVTPPRAAPRNPSPAPGEPLQRRRNPGAMLPLEDASKGGGRERVLTGDLTWQVRDIGLRCVAAPCPTFRAIRLEAEERQPEEVVHEVDFSRAKLSERELARAQALLTSGLRVEGRIRWVPNRGPAGGARILEVRRIVPTR